ncbi:MAG: cyclic nucleotide-binding/CBS domain-containing protein [Candidatus Woesearchaeota archaeon]
MFLAEDIMTRKVESVSENASVKTISEKMAKKNISSVIVYDKNKKPKGIISEKDFVKKVLSKNSKKGLNAKKIMSSPILSVRPKESVNNAAKTMRENGIRHLLVTEKESIKGIITETDVLSGETEYIRAHQFLQNLIMALFITILLLFVIVFRVKP